MSDHQLGFADAFVDPRMRAAEKLVGLMEEVLAEVNGQLEARGLMVRKGTPIDATLVSAASRRPPLGAGSKPRLPREPEATFTRKDGTACFGWRLRLGMDAGSGPVHRALVIPAHVNESPMAEALICGDEAAVYADEGYENKHRRRALKARGIEDRILHRNHKHQVALPHWQAVRNKLVTPRRAPVEGVFGTLERTCRRARSRSCGLTRTAADLIRVLTVYNLGRAIALRAT